MACAQLHISNHKADNNFNSFASRSCSMSVGVSERMLGFWSSENMVNKVKHATTSKSLGSPNN